ncbi:uncharacterized protein K452DRAFT_313543 [Aplosporella prunicola CBS 121167]|uniref:Uncharacterized protein n=1 Tax=Aplosporella prunicola CBS 121167 TaxID=1176127 RepID=A0A6A6AXV2_9PEZI|nr:uncharacterized protein K452DRAFT_313543 [Aplosporella prunicola CBS 121167]KAF2135993.1 hypothetical protein K452DRAFT_313543 [Aplosporella prunicola CBS 121167]
MFFSTAQVAALAFALTNSVAALPDKWDSSLFLPEENKQVDGKRIIGYNIVTEGRTFFKNYNGQKCPTNGASFAQLGDGTYIYSDFGDFAKVDDSDSICVYVANDAFVDAPKAWIPQTVDDKELWGNNTNIDGHIRDLDNDWTPATTIRLGNVEDGPESVLQIVLPEAFESDDALGISYKCYSIASVGPWESTETEPLLWDGMRNCKGLQSNFCSEN